MPTDSSAAATPTSSETRVPHQVSSRTERPDSSVPNQYLPDGAVSGSPPAAVTSSPAGSDSTGAASASNTVPSRTASPSTTTSAMLTSAPVSARPT